MIYICVICTGRKRGLLSLSDEHRQILEAIVSPTLNLEKLKSFPLWICKECKCLINTVQTFKNIAEVGASHLLGRLDLLEKEDDGTPPPENPSHSPVKQEDLDDLLEAKTFIEVPIDEQNVQTQETEIDIKIEFCGSDDERSESPVVPELRPFPCQVKPPVTPVVKPFAPAVKMPTLVLHPLIVGGSSEDRQADDLKPQLPRLIQKPVTGPPSSLDPLTLALGGATVDTDSVRCYPESTWLVKVLSEREALSAREAARSAPEFAEAAFRCDSCVLVFGDETEMAIHAETHAPSAGANVCHICQQRVRASSSMPAHVARHTTRYYCRQCRYDTDDRGDIERHRCDQPQDDLAQKGANGKKPPRKRIRKPRPPGAFRCKACHTTYVKQSGLTLHNEKYHKDQYICEICKKEFNSKKRLKCHVKNHTEKESQSVDTIQPELFCGDCGIQFQKKQCYMSHFRSLKHRPREEWKFKCETCGKKFNYKADLKKHVNYVHLKKPDLCCEQCNKPFLRPNLLQLHIATVHEGKERPRTHICHVCGGAFMTKKTLEEHLRTHSDDRPHLCPLCPATFKFKAALYTHNRLKHLKEKCRKKTKKGTKKKEREDGTKEREKGKVVVKTLPL